MMSRISIGLVAASLLMMIGCSKNSPTQTGSGNNNNNNSNYAVGEFGYVYNGKTIDSKNNPRGGSAGVIYQPNARPGINPNISLLTIQLGFYVAPGLTNEGEVIAIGIPILSTSPQTYSIGSSTNQAAATASLSVNDSVSYSSIAGGAVAITAFDTVNNLVSGTFNFIATSQQTHPGFSNTDTVVSGFFNKIPIIAGALGQGSFTATAGLVDFSTSPYMLYAYTTPYNNWLTILGTETVDSLDRQVEITMVGPSVGTFPFGGNLTSPGQWIAAYFENPIYGAQRPYVSVNAIRGQVQITSYDTVKHRLSGTFSFAGVDSYSGDSVQVTNGKIDNVYWGDE